MKNLPEFQRLGDPKKGRKGLIFDREERSGAVLIMGKLFLLFLLFLWFLWVIDIIKKVMKLQIIGKN